MHHIRITLFIICFSQWLNSQSFEIPVYFEDAIGNRDSVVLGYDEIATYGIDTNLGEVDLIDMAYSGDFEIRAAIYEYGWEFGSISRIIESKRMIIGPVCHDSTYSEEANSIMVVIKCDHWPVTLRWDQSLFQEQCNYLDIINCTPGGWFDVCGGIPLMIEMQSIDTVSYLATAFQFIDKDDTLGTLFFPFYNDFDTDVSETTLENELSLFPNPNEGVVHFDFTLHEHDQIILRDHTGRRIPFNHSNQQIDFTEAPDGMYILSIQLPTSRIFSKQIFKRSN